MSRYEEGLIKSGLSPDNWYKKVMQNRLNTLYKRREIKVKLIQSLIRDEAIVKTVSLKRQIYSQIQVIQVSIRMLNKRITELER